MLNLDKLTSYCPGCGHGVVTRLVAEAIEELGIRQRAIAIVGIGCGGFSHHYMDIDAIEATHGRAPSFAVGYKLARPDNIVFTYAGDGDTSAIGIGDLLHAANKGMPITTIMINNTVFGMTGGQMSPTTLEGQVTTTTPKGRDLAGLSPAGSRDDARHARCEIPGTRERGHCQTYYAREEKHQKGLRMSGSRSWLLLRGNDRPLSHRPQEIRTRLL